MKQYFDVPFKVAKTHLGELDGLRGLMALIVIIDHSSSMAGLRGEDFLSPLRFLIRGEMGVQVFVILSGFVIFMLMEREHVSYVRYIGRRFLRLFPAYILCLLAGISLTFFAPSILQSLPWQGQVLHKMQEEWLSIPAHFWTHLCLHLTMLHGVLPQEALPFSATAFLGPAWSISLEWQFYFYCLLSAAVS